MTTLATRLTIKRLHPLFVAEVTGIDLTRPIPREDFRTIWEAFNEHQILVFRDQAFDDASQIAFSRNFGSLETMIAHPGNDWNPGHISVMTNLGKDGNFLPLDHPAMVHRERNEAWHSDSSFKPVAALASLLSARIVPPVGGNTDFASARAAYDALSEQRKAELEGVIVVHRMTHPDMENDKGYRDEDKKRHVVTHPLIRTNPVNGRKALYVGAHAQEIIGMPPQEGSRILDELTAFCTQPQFVYSHHWRDGDAVMWDNRCTLHRATPFDKTKYKRKLHRTTIAGKAPDSAFATMPEPRVA
ncbi:MAG TPA: TauD/TfdA family dioxygenase [Burkholderiales bacterium]|nr:TauD/TfdA family dioxygenase [Burkholderiales bacterium]